MIRPLGRNGPAVGRFGLGTMAFASPAADPDECVRVVHAALDAGITLFDTADVYGTGQAEQLLGRALGARRDEVAVATKFGLPMGGDGENGASARWIRQALTDSLRRLGTDHVELLQMHRPDATTPIEETIDALEQLRTEGLIGAYGCSTLTATALRNAAAVASARRAAGFTTEQLPLSLFVRSREPEVIPTCGELGIGVIAWSPLNGGWLTGKYRPGTAPPPGSRGSIAGSFVDPTDAAKATLIGPLTELAAEAGTELTDLALAWVARHPGVACTLVGARTVAQFEAAIPAFGLVLDESILARIDLIVSPGTSVDPRNDAWG